MAGQPELIAPGIVTHEARIAALAPGATAGLPWFELWAFPDSHGHNLRAFGPGEAVIASGSKLGIDLSFSANMTVADRLEINLRFASNVTGVFVARNSDKRFVIQMPRAKTYQLNNVWQFPINARWVQFQLINSGANAINNLDYIVILRGE